jgi:four helix bundle protein
MSNFRDLSIWLKSHLLTLNIYSETKSFPKVEMFGLVSQMRRLASSIPTNTTEGCGQNRNPDFSRFLVMAAGSACKLEYQVILSWNLKFLSGSKFKEL